MVTKQELKDKAVKNDIAATFTAMNGLHEKNGMDVATGAGKGVAWCGACVETVFKLAGFGDALKGISNPLYVPSYITDGKKLDLVENIKDKPPAVGSIVTFKKQNHIGVVTKVNEDGSFLISQGNTTNMVQTLKYNMEDFKNGHLDKEYLSAQKLDAHNKKQNPTAPTLGQKTQIANNNTQTITESNKLPTFSEVQKIVKTNGANQSYDLFSQQLSGIKAGEQEKAEKSNPTVSLFLQMLAALVVAASGQDVIVQANANEQQRREALNKVDSGLRDKGTESNPNLPTKIASLTQLPRPTTPISNATNTSLSSPVKVQEGVPTAKGNNINIPNWR
jgi:CHAP domain